MPSPFPGMDPYLEREVWPLRLQEVIPILPVLLLPSDADVPLDLGRALAVIYDRSGYHLRID